MRTTEDRHDQRSWERDLRAYSIARSAEVRAWAADVLSGLDGHVMADVTLVVDELLSNAFEHGSGPRRVGITWPAVPELIKVEVEDNSDALPRVRKRAIEPHGWGMRLVERLARAWGVEPTANGKTVWALIPGRAMTGEAPTVVPQR